MRVTLRKQAMGVSPGLMVDTKIGGKRAAELEWTIQKVRIMIGSLSGISKGVARYLKWENRCLGSKNESSKGHWNAIIRSFPILLIQSSIHFFHCRPVHSFNQSFPFYSKFYFFIHSISRKWLFLYFFLLHLYGYILIITLIKSSAMKFFSFFSPCKGVSTT